MPIFLTFPHMEVQGANAHATGWMLSTCPAMAATMMAENFGFQLRLGEKPSGVAIIHHDAQLLAEKELPKSFNARFPHQFRGSTMFNMKDVNSKYMGKQPVNGLQPTASMNGTWSLILKFDETSIENRLPDAARVFLRSARFAGGSIVDHGDPVVGRKLVSRGVRKEDQGVFDRSIGNGFAIVDRTHLISSTGRSKIASLLSLAAGDAGSDEEKEGEGVKMKWYVPAVLGYAMMTEFQERKNVRNNKPHAFCEPMVGLTEYISVRQLDEHELHLEDVFWRHKWLNESVFAITH